MFTKVRLAALAAGLLIPAGVAAPAFASGPTDTVNVTVGQEISLTGLTDVVFSGLPGTTANGCPVASPGCATSVATESYTIASNDPLGYSLSEQASTDNFQPNNAIPDSAWSIQNNSPVGVVTFSPSSSAFQVFKSPAHVTAGDAITEFWTLALPSNLAQGTYTNQLTYLATGS